MCKMHFSHKVRTYLEFHNGATSSLAMGDVKKIATVAMWLARLDAFNCYIHVNRRELTRGWMISESLHGTVYTEMGEVAEEEEA